MRRGEGEGRGAEGMASKMNVQKQPRRESAPPDSYREGETPAAQVEAGPAEARRKREEMPMSWLR